MTLPALRLRVPSNSLPGTYYGVFLSRTGLRCGCLGFGSHGYCSHVYSDTTVEALTQWARAYLEAAEDRYPSQFHPARVWARALWGVVLDVKDAARAYRERPPARGLARAA